MPQPLPDAGKPQASERKEMASAESAFELLALAAASFTQPGLGLAVMLDRAAQAIADLLGDGCVLRLLSADGERLVPVAVRHRVPSRLDAFHHLVDATPAFPARGPYAQALAASEAVSFDAKGPKPSQTRSDPPSAAHGPGVGCFMLAALRTPRATLGTLGVSRDEPALPFTSSERLLLQELACRAALSIENARLLEEEQRARGRAELAAWALREKVDALETAETRFRVAFEGTTVGMAVLTPRWEFLQANHALRTLLGYAEDDLTNSPFLAIVHAGDDAAMRQDARILRAGGQPTPAPRRLLRVDREPVWTLITASLVLDHAGEPNAVIVHVQPCDSSAPKTPPPPMASGDLTSLGRILSNPVNLDLLRRLIQEPTHPRALARVLNRSEGDVQRKLRALEGAGLVAGAWRTHGGVTTKEYQATARTLQLSLG
jgi:PAS domain S-box-containing protein